MKTVIATALAALAAMPAAAEDSLRANPLTASPVWDEIRPQILGQDAPLAQGPAPFEIEAPYRAEDAATVPIRIRQTDPEAHISRARLVIDENPMPLAADIVFGPAMAPLDLELRARVNQYSNVRVIADTETGLFMDGRFVKASGGCSAPASKSPDLALADIGRMRLKPFADTAPALSTPRRETQIMIRHPNYSGLQRDQVTQLFIPPLYLDRIEVRQGDELLFRVEGGISISENPVFRFSYSDNGAASLHVRAEDTDGHVFEQDLPKDGQI
ncbi:quinoprotein dehydrogenase-associated SoxYZ-like carrier [Rhodovulum kholense]|uniref:Sulfur-oxidizing protein SoxY n=1 Tax=Rhodovulum kholense TaxID=453584 RepID=A0A8E2VI91_9RHOB|nr:quinoprotein dehydrogenase-associated SoxYZ-like carrier [Rhodovulum kholense]PTW42391.1 sulfur-oxidizing protein SoxY [Rhodovulum kholense]